MDLCKLTIHELHDLILKKKTTSREITEAFYRRIKQVDGKTRAYLLLTEELAYQQADQVDKKISRGEEIGDLARYSSGSQRYSVYPRNPDNLRFEDAGELCPFL